MEEEIEALWIRMNVLRRTLDVKGQDVEEGSVADEFDRLQDERNTLIRQLRRQQRDR